MEAMSKEFDGIVAAGNLYGNRKNTEGPNIVDTKCLYKCKGDYHCSVDRRMPVEWLCGLAR